MREYTGVVLGPPRQVETLKAKDLDAAKKQMEKKHGPQFDGEVKRWSCGLSVKSFHDTRPQ